MHWTQRVVVAGVSAAVAASQALAQGAPGPALPPVADPPARVGRLGELSGIVSFHLAGADRWDAATPNLPVSTGTVTWTEPGARAVVEATGTRIRLDQSTELDMTRLDDRALEAALPQGAVCILVRTLLPGETTTVQTPRAQVSLTKPGRYEVTAGDTTHPSVVTVIEGEADLSSTGMQIHAGPNQAATVTGDGQATPFAAALGAASRDPFLQSCLADDRPIRARTVQVPSEVQRMTGGYALDEYGDWDNTPEYGAIWYPPADPGFVPYRHGHWGYVAPWGWTWVDDAPWGFAPSHYGRWVAVHDRWGWIPGSDGPGYPVYAPAVVSFLAGGAVGALAGAAIERGSVGWVPLGPREPYYPPYRVSPGYLQTINASHVTNVNTVITTYNNVINRPGLGSRGVSQPPQFAGGALVNRAAATSVPATAMAGSQSLGSLARPVNLPVNPTLAARAPIGPTGATFGITPAVARQFGLRPEASRPPAPGPMLQSSTSGLGPVGEPVRPSLGTVGGAALGGAVAGGSAAALLRPGAPAPALRPAAEGRPVLRPQGEHQGERSGEPLPGHAGQPGPAPSDVAPREARPERASSPHVIRPDSLHVPGPQAGRPSMPVGQTRMARPAPSPAPGPAPSPAPRPLPRPSPPSPSPPHLPPPPMEHPAPQTRPGPAPRPTPSAPPAPPSHPGGGHPPHERQPG